MANINHYLDFVRVSNITPTTGCVVLGDDGGLSEFVLWNFFEKVIGVDRSVCDVAGERSEEIKLRSLQ
jgi:hypothetical protein